MSESVPVIIYSALSKKDDDGCDSIQSQVREIREMLDHVGGRIEVADPFADHGYSGSKRNRGPGLEQAIRAALSAAEEFGRAELWAVTSSRFARGSGRVGESRAVGALFYELRAKGVALRTVHDDEFVTNEMLIGFASRQASKSSEDLSASVKRSKRRQAEAGERLGGPWPLGYQAGEGLPDPEHVATIERIFELAADGVPDGQLARSVNAEGRRTRAGRPFDRRSIQAIVTNPTYAALVIHDDVEHEGRWQPLVDRQTWHRIQLQRVKRDLGAGHHVKGRPAHRHLLAKLARCGECGSPMFTATSSYRRKDGTRDRQYQCRSYRTSDGTCNAKPVDAEVVDTAVLENLYWLMPRFDEWIAQIETRHSAERARLEIASQQAIAERDIQRRKLEHAQDRWLGLAAEDQDLLLPALRRARDELERSEVRAQATGDALASVPEDVAHERLLDFAVNLRSAISSKIEGDRTVAELNRALIEVFASFTISRELPDDVPQETTLDRIEADHALDVDGLYIVPNLRIEIVGRLLAEHDPDVEESAPPMEWIDALAKSANTHE